MSVDLESIGKIDSEIVEHDGFDERDELLKEGGELGSLSNGVVDSVHVLDRISELGLKRLKSDVAVGNGNGHGDEGGKDGALLLEEGELSCLKSVIMEHADVFDALCCNIENQVKGCERERDDTGVAITVGKAGEEEEVVEEGDLKVLGLVQKSVQRAHLDAMKECMEGGDVDGAVLHIRYLHFDYGLPEAEYRYVYYNFFSALAFV